MLCYVKKRNIAAVILILANYKIKFLIEGWKGKRIIIRTDVMPVVPKVIGPLVKMIQMKVPHWGPEHEEAYARNQHQSDHSLSGLHHAGRAEGNRGRDGEKVQENQAG